MIQLIAALDAQAYDAFWLGVKYEQLRYWLDREAEALRATNDPSLYVGVTAGEFMRLALDIADRHENERD